MRSSLDWIPRRSANAPRPMSWPRRWSTGGVRSHVFGMVGHSNLGLADSHLRLQVREREASSDTSVSRHEGAAAFAASAYGKLTGMPAACLTIAGPGATNLLTGMWDAKVDRAPILALTGQVQTQVFGPGAFPGHRSQVRFPGCVEILAAGAERRRSTPNSLSLACKTCDHRAGRFASHLSG